MTLRRDLRQWLIYDEEPVTSTVRAVEALAMIVAGPILARHPAIEMRAVGTAMERIGRTRLAALGGRYGDVPDTDRQVAEHLTAVLCWLDTGVDTPEAARARDELHAALFWLDARLRDAGASGPGWYRELVRGER